MDRIYTLFLNILKSALQAQTYTDTDNITQEQWTQIFSLSQSHNVLPLIYQAVYNCPALSGSMALRSKVRQLVMLQTVKTTEFLQLYSKLKEADCTPLVVKGYVCRSLYPQPDLRLSTDEDMLIPQDKFEKCVQVFKEFGLDTETPAERFTTEYEIPFRKTGSPLYIELHKTLFPTDSQAYGNWNSFFTDVFDNAVMIDGIMTLNHTDHLFYLICHAFKHFIHSGFGIRQVCDIVIYANAYGAQIDWQKVFDNCKVINADVFAATLFRIGENHLIFDKEKANYPAGWSACSQDETNMLADMLSGGVFGGSTMSRRHSSNITLDAVVADKKGKKAGKSLKGTLFPPAEKLQSRYPYLEKKPYLLPKAWASRAMTYAKELRSSNGNSAIDSLKIAGSRVDLLKEYKIIK